MNAVRSIAWDPVALVTTILSVAALFAIAFSATQSGALQVTLVNLGLAVVPLLLFTGNWQFCRTEVKLTESGLLGTTWGASRQGFDAVSDWGIRGNRLLLRPKPGTFFKYPQFLQLRLGYRWGTQVVALAPASAPEVEEALASRLGAPTLR